MLVATAGHVDHGKTELIRALTGVETDRLPEEKQRGLSIDLGFAYRALADGSVLGFVDVPGHERFVRNMLAGVPAIDIALLLIAADDGPMPQTREHLAILDLLGIERAVIAITKTDIVDVERVRAVEQEARELVAGTGLADAQCFAISSVTGEGIPALERHLTSIAATVPARSDAGAFRLAIDRSFTLPGAGLVVTGAVFAGRAAVGDRLLLVPGDVPVRVRGIHAQDREATAGAAGERLAVNLAGVPGRDALHRGQWLVSEHVGEETWRMDARLRVLPSEERALHHWTPVHVHHGSAGLTGRVCTLEGRAIEPGDDGLVQVVLDRPTHAVRGDRFVLRDQSARRTLAGGVVIDPLAPRKGRSQSPRLELLRSVERLEARDTFARLLELAPVGVDERELVRALNLTPGEGRALLEAVDSRRLLVGGRTVRITPRRREAMADSVREVLAEWHLAHPDETGPDEATLRARLPPGELRAVVLAVVEELLRAGELKRSATALHLAGHRPRMPAQDAALWARVEALVGPTVLQPGVIHELAGRLEIEPDALEAFFKRAAARGLLARVAPNRYLHHEALARLALAAARLARERQDGRFDARTYKDAAGIGRNFCIQLLEFFDIAKLTRRLGDERIVIGDPATLFGAVPGEEQAPEGT